MKTARKILLYLVLIFIAATVTYNFWPEQKLPSGSKIDFLLVEKSKRTMKAYQGAEPLKTYQISLGDNPIGHKVFEGDEKTPEGVYRINDRNPNSGYHKNLGVSYPNQADREKAKLLGKSPGGDIKIHGLPNGATGMINKLHRFTNWTNGCIAVTNSEVDELYEAVIPNAKIEIRP
ncbi:L,D-transpeptidase family protein [Pedobacter xixiisoli]|uniref:L,D-transpeptidase catalytic domain n=1 Tax=Pedobacter xixiisoli TaxID=1476464 RepID=A0A285ZNI5_9SPHI|nr:L,D-transpeptidase family protein [Pedobacter xixiisoli]SOD11215.1 L,D-transpeptidase catalytic domain [Pedobacter xixiisoli]